MSVLTNKNILFVGEENLQIKDLKKSLEAHGINVHAFSCDLVSPEKIEAQKVDLIFVNYLNESLVCKDMLNTLRTADLSRAVPIFILAQDESEKIQEVLLLGAADYVTVSEDVESIIQKIKVIFGQGYDFSGDSVIDITPSQADVTSTGIRVFVVEDDPLLRNLLSIRLERSSFPYEFSVDGKGALPTMKQFRPDIIILDLMLPGRSGFEVLAEIKGDDNLKEIPVIIFSNRDGQDDRRKAKELGAVGFYVKAMTDLSELIEMIESYVK